MKLVLTVAVLTVCLGCAPRGTGELPYAAAENSCSRQDFNQLHLELYEEPASCDRLQEPGSPGVSVRVFWDIAATGDAFDATEYEVRLCGDDGCVQADDGWIEVQHLDRTGSVLASGEYDLTFGTQHLEGTFHALECWNDGICG